ncbi:MAG: hypothetical protein L6R35_001939 [Caloplaca aegaea]|nr:MAG: hypothetical protein L6R35_001939 [Caloplaca aegaea]
MSWGLRDPEINSLSAKLLRSFGAVDPTVTTAQKAGFLATSWIVLWLKDGVGGGGGGPAAAEPLVSDRIDNLFRPSSSSHSLALTFAKFIVEKIIAEMALFIPKRPK